MTFVLVFTLLCPAVPVYVYFGCPALLWPLTRGLPDITHRRVDQKPSVALIISCYNEEGVIREKLQNALELDYPQELLQIIVVSDGSDEAAKEFEDERVVLIRQERRLGKTMGFNLAMEQVDADITVFSDANAIYASDAITKLVRSFADLEVGYVVGGDGAICAIRTKLWEPLQQRDINDLGNSQQVIAKGYRGVFDAEARCFEETAGIFVFEVISHKLFRWLIPLFLLAGVAGCVILAFAGYGPFKLITAGTVLLLVLTLLGHLSANRSQLPIWIATPYYFVMVNGYAVHGVVKALQGRTQVTWNSARSSQEQR